MLPRLLILLVLLSAFAAADDSRTEFGGHAKLRLLGQSYPSESVFRDVFGGSSLATEGDLRLNLTHRRGGWTFNSNYQLAASDGEAWALPDDRRRLFDLTSVIDDGDESALLHRLDRLWIGHSSEKTVFRLGRQALSWGNGLFYAPMDLVNPFDPAAVDTEYKPGDDMLYVQYLKDSGADIQGAYVARRDLFSGDAQSDVATIATKYHGFAGESEFDVLVARHYGDTVLGFGGSHELGGAHWSGDLVVTDTEIDTYLQFTTNLSYSWTWAGKNMSGVIEYHFNGFGQHPDDYGPVSLSDNPDLTVRLSRGESFALGRNYLAGSVLIEMTPLWSMTPNLLCNVGDTSALLQLVSNYSLGDNMTLLGSFNLPIGSSGSEFGGVDSGAPGRYLSRGTGVFAQFAWYF